MCALLITTGCTKEKNVNRPTSSNSFVGLFIIWNGSLYLLTTEHVKEVDKQIGTVNHAVTNDQDVNYDLKNTISNAYPVGTKIYSLPSKSDNDYIAAPNKDGYYDVFKNHGKYGSKEPAPEQ